MGNAMPVVFVEEKISVRFCSMRTRQVRFSERQQQLANSRNKSIFRGIAVLLFWHVLLVYIRMNTSPKTLNVLSAENHKRRPFFNLYNFVVATRGERHNGTEIL